MQAALNEFAQAIRNLRDEVCRALGIPAILTWLAKVLERIQEGRDDTTTEVP